MSSVAKGSGFRPLFLLLLSVLSGALGRLQRTGGKSRACAGAAHDAWNYQDAGSTWNIGECCLGTGQSPLNLSAVATAGENPQGGAKIFYGYKAVAEPITIMNDGHGLVIELGARYGGYAMGSSFPDLVSSRWLLWKVTVHMPSEHTFEGVRVPLELQVFHRRRGNKLDDPATVDMNVVSVGYVAGGRTSKLLDVLQSEGLPQKPGDRVVANAAAKFELDFLELFGLGARGVEGGPKSKMFWDYEGSITTPPCSRGVTWLVRDDPLSATPETLDAFMAVITAVTPASQHEVGNARKLQSPCGRSVTLRSTEDVTAQMDINPTVADAEFEAATARAAAAQKAFQESMQRKASPYTDCLDRLSMAVKELKAAKKQQTFHCKQQQAAKDQLPTAEPGLGRLHIVTTLKGCAAQCRGATKAVDALTQELSSGTITCNTLKESEETAAKEAAASAATGIR